MDLKTRKNIPLDILGLIFFLSGCAFLTPMSGPEEENVNAGSSSSENNKVQIETNYGKLPLYFIQNDGQVDERVKFYEKGNGHTTFFTKEGVYLVLTRSLEKTDQNENSALKSSPIPPGAILSPHSRISHGEMKSEVIKLNFLNANPDPEIIAEGLQEGKANYFIGNDPENWRTNIPTYQSVVYKEPYPGIDIKFYGNNRQMEYDIIVKPGADPSKLKFSYEGVENLEVAENGDLVALLKQGKIIQKRPVVYQKIDGQRVAVDGKFKILEENILVRAETSEVSVHPSIFSPSVVKKMVDLSGEVFKYTFEVAVYDRRFPLNIDRYILHCHPEPIRCFYLDQEEAPVWGL